MMNKRQERMTEPAELFSPLFGTPDKTSFQIKDGQKVYEVTTYFSSDGKQSVLQQFKELILSENLLLNRTFDNIEEAL